ncbi:MAG: methyltransferase domain-containing protein [Verrucomicrobiota bacterium]
MDDVVQQAVAADYDSLDGFYRTVFGGRVHHAWWGDGAETLAAGLLEMERRFTEFVELAPGMNVCDVGCGYGKMASSWVRDHGVRVTAVTNSGVQAAAMEGLPGLVPVHADWSGWNAPAAAFDRVVAMESLEHMSAPAAEVAKMARALAPGGKLVLAVWLMPESTCFRWLWRFIRKTGGLAGIASDADVRGWLRDAGLECVEELDLASGVGKTWTACLAVTLREALANGVFRRKLLADWRNNAMRGAAALAVAVCYATGHAGYRFFKAARVG